MAADGQGGANAQELTRQQRLLQARVQYLHDVVSPERLTRIVDVGANPINDPLYANLLNMGYCEVWGFEPQEQAFQALMEASVPNTHFVQKAVGRTGKGMFYDHPESGLSSLYPIRKESVTYLNHPGWHREEVTGTEVELTALDDMVEVPRTDVLKIDIQGGELDVIESGRDKLSEAICIITETRFYRMYEDEPMMAALDFEIHDQGFCFHTFEFTKKTLIRNSQRKRMGNPVFRRQMLDGDAIYIRNPETIEEWSDEQVRHLAIVSAGLISSYDLCVYCLDEMVRRGSVSDEVPGAFVDRLPGWMLRTN